MPAMTYYMRPPSVQAVQFDGTNAAELAELAGVETPTVETDESGKYILINLPSAPGMMGRTLRVNEAEWLVASNGPCYTLSDQEFQAQYTR